MRCIILDVESTGLLTEDKNHRLTEICALEMINFRLTGQKFHVYLNPGREVGKVAMKLTDLNYKFLKNKDKFSDIIEPFMDFISNSTLVAHNAKFDISFINHELNLANYKIKDISISRLIVDTLALARALYPNKRNSLNALCKRYFININRKKHSASIDAFLLSKVYINIINLKNNQCNLTMDCDDKNKTIKHKNYKLITTHKKEKVILLNASIVEENIMEHYSLSG